MIILLVRTAEKKWRPDISTAQKNTNGLKKMGRLKGNALWGPLSLLADVLDNIVCEELLLKALCVRNEEKL